MSTPHPDELAGLAALVTGGASGIGLATALLLASRGARVAILDREIPGRIDALELQFIADVTDDDAVRSAVTASAERLGGLDILVNNAGIGAAGTVEDNDDDEWRRVLDVNVLGIVRTTRPAAARPRSSTPARSWPPRACRSEPCTRRARARSSR
jgi:2-keto-3-deoxy-L-fuconate dehydrogenase